MGNTVGSSTKKDDDGEFSDEETQSFMKGEKQKCPTAYGSSPPARDFPQSYHKTSVHTRSLHREPPRENVCERGDKLDANLLFYQNKLKTQPGVGYCIEEILKWHGDYAMLDRNPYCIQWLFPTNSKSSGNPKAQPLQAYEVIAIRSNELLMSRAVKAFVMMLDYYGMRPVIHQDGSLEVERSSNWMERYQKLNNSSRHHFRRITRILSSMGALGFGQYQCVWLRFLLIEAVQNKTLECLDGENIPYWIDTMENDNYKAEIWEFYDHLKTQHDGVQTTLTLTASSNLGHELEEDLDCEESEMKISNGIEFDNIVNISEQSCVFMEKECEKSHHCLMNMPNVQFYLNRIKSKPEPGFYLEELKREAPDFYLMQKMHNHIQWLFPNPNQSEVNPESKPLTETEALVFQNVAELRERFVEVYRLMLACYGLDLVSMDTGEIQKIVGWKEKLYDMNKLTALPRIITRILTSLAVLGFAQYQVPLAYFLLREAMVEKSLPSLDGNHVEYWIGVIENNEDRQRIADAWKSLKESQQCSVPTEWNLPHIVRTEGVTQDGIDKVANDTGITEWNLPQPGRKEDVREDGANQGSGDTGKTSSVVKSVKNSLGGIKKSVGNFFCGTEMRGSVDRMEEGPYYVTQKLCANVEFYGNKKKSSLFWGHKIEDMLQWKGDYYKLEMNHQYIQWLFPIPEGSGVNPSAQPLQAHEAEMIKDSTILRRRVLRSYEMMLDFYGMKLVSEGSTDVQRSHNWQERYHHLNRSGHNHLRITRIIKSIGHLGLQNYQLPWVKFILHEIFEASVLPRLGGRQVMFWIDAIADESEKQEAYAAYVTLKEKHR